MSPHHLSKLCRLLETHGSSKVHCKRDLPKPVRAWQCQPAPGGRYKQRESEGTERPRHREVSRGHGSLHALLKLLFSAQEEEEEEEEGGLYLRAVQRAALG